MPPNGYSPPLLGTGAPTQPGSTITTPLTAQAATQAAAAGAQVIAPDNGIQPQIAPSEAKKNAQANFTELALQAYVQWDAFTLVNQALADHENGLFRSAALLVDAFGRDDRISGVSATRLNTVFSLPLSFEPTKTKTRGSQRIADDLAESNLWAKMFPLAELRKLLRWGLFSGVGVADLVWRDWVPTLRVWHPQYLYWDWGTYRYFIATTAGVVPVTPGDGKWILYTPFGFKYGWMEGLVRSLSAPWFYRKFNFRDWARYCEVHGLPIRKAIVPIEADDKHGARFVTEMTGLGTESVVRIPQGPKDQPGYDLQLLEASADTYGGFQAFMEQIDASIAITLLGQNLTTSVKGGSFAAAKVHDAVRSDLRAFDAASMSECLRTQALRWWVAFNYSMGAADDLCPIPTWQTEPPEDKGQKATALQALGMAIASFRQNGVTLDWRKLFLDFGLPVVGMGIDPTVPLPGQQQPDDDGGDDRDPSKKLPKGKKPTDVVKNALAELRATSQSGWQRGQRYADQIAAMALREGARVVGRDIAAVLQVVRQAKDPAELRTLLLETFGAMNPGQLAQIERKAAILARLDGRVSVLEDL